MSNSKGKGPATGDEDGEINTSETSTEPSFLSRVTASASGLTRNAFSRPAGNELNQQVATALSDAGKGQSSSGTPREGSWEQSSKFSQFSHYAQASGSSGLRAGQTEAHVRQSENEFSDFLDGIDSFTPPEGITTGLPDGFEQAWAHSQGVQPQPNINSAPRTVEEQERREGEDVLALLSDPSALDEQFEGPEEDDEHYDWGLSQDQIIELRAMTKEMFPPPEQHTGVSANNPLNLIPMSGEFDQQQWFEQWDGVLNRYADEVWGGLLPLVAEARKELDEMQNGDPPMEQPKALRRLNAILGHLQKR
ncbi:uncharacterized protein PAC_03707 [Phialocephala subalpina]|uniref:Uncharacterized protein n=1 Tax=Phialocephala subalpina TaxID=576137 RepID=A0A1L7WM47_9HELO|nr:uncharacterized protein PAC_03707 [Phialocephala subalpina]